MPASRAVGELFLGNVVTEGAGLNVVELLSSCETLLDFSGAIWRCGLTKLVSLSQPHPVLPQGDTHQIELEQIDTSRFEPKDPIWHAIEGPYILAEL